MGIYGDVAFVDIQLKRRELMKALNKKTPQWFKDWRNNEFWHMAVEVRATTIIITIIFAIEIAIAIKVLWG